MAEGNVYSYDLFFGREKVGRYNSSRELAVNEVILHAQEHHQITALTTATKPSAVGEAIIQPFVKPDGWVSVGVYELFDGRRYLGQHFSAHKLSFGETIEQHGRKYEVTQYDYDSAILSFDKIYRTMVRAV